MKPSSRFQYALRALVDLALHQAGGPVTVSLIAKRQGIPVRFLEQLFNQLRRKGVVVAERGPRGGHRLTRPADQISIQEIFDIFESTSSQKTPWKKDGASDPARSVWDQVEKAIRNTLGSTTLKNLADQLHDQIAAPVQHRYPFHI